MTTKIDDKARAAIARGWTASALSQPEYARLHGISARTLREWCLRFAPTGPPVRQARLIIEEAMRRLQDLLAAIDDVKSAQVIADVGTPVGEAVPAAPSSTPPGEPGMPVGIDDQDCSDSVGGDAPERERALAQHFPTPPPPPARLPGFTWD